MNNDLLIRLLVFVVLTGIAWLGVRKAQQAIQFAKGTDKLLPFNEKEFIAGFSNGAKAHRKAKSMKLKDDNKEVITITATLELHEEFHAFDIRIDHSEKGYAPVTDVAMMRKIIGEMKTAIDEIEEGVRRGDGSVRVRQVRQRVDKNGNPIGEPVPVEEDDEDAIPITIKGVKPDKKDSSKLS